MPAGDVRAILTYHEGTKHSFDSVYRRPHTLDWSIMPRPFKVYPDLEPLPLPQDFTSSTRPALGAIADTGAVLVPGPPLDRRLLAQLLYFTAGVLRRRDFSGGEVFFRAAACTGALHHVDGYLVCGDLPDLEAGVYHFGPHDFSLVRLRRGDHRAVLAGGATDAPATLVWASTFWRNAWKYRERTYRHCWWDGGTILANLLAMSAAHGVRVAPQLGFVDDHVARLLDLDSAREAPLVLTALGASASPPSAAPPAPPLGLETLPLSAREVDYPAIRAAHGATAFAAPVEFAAWRDVEPPAPRPQGTDGIPLPPVGPAHVSEPVEAIILRRGSARAFAPAPMTLAELATVLWSTTRGVHADVLAPGAPLCDVYLIVRAVDGLEPGAYVYDRGAHALVALRGGDFARDAGHLALGQALAAEAAVNLYWLSDLDAVMARLGARGYRAASLEAGIEGGRAYLAAYALRLGATGLTFFDDEVTAFFSPHGAGKRVMFLVACGRRRRGAPLR